MLNGQAVTSTRNAALHHIFKLEQSAAHELIREPDFVVSLGRAINKHKQQWSYPTLSDVPSSLVDKILSASPKHNSKVKIITNLKIINEMEYFFLYFLVSDTES